VFGGGVDAGAVCADGAPGRDEFGDAAALGSGAPAAQQFGDIGCVKVAGEDLAQRFFEWVGTPKDRTAAFDLPQGLRLGVVEIGGVFSSAQRAPLNALAMR